VRPGRDADPSPSFSAEVKNRVILLLSLRAFVAYDKLKPTYNKILSLQQALMFVAFPHSGNDEGVNFASRVEFF
jgi:hypothetical protein